ncbi:XRE family transcriptional regulator [Geobacillus subterraneus]|uniref:XRE family transcriptional regulator n=2 Tax=Geobacillus TaxID=129337 RepID=A0ABM6AAA4_9BACL|nr:MULTISPECIES: helix-turn-helix transcriptional regulator [Geobacillus]ADI25302.1 transcriptional regulator, XRE family [Geobacillus sp. C56-T3]AMX83155.1 XRE family transcriptional regulator [Geobacillus subterraneus]KZS24482.1 XRE family transcriptional regulator [Geobacillus subterraneus]OXB90575.1 transcriptional regulator [Geobacillus uzenensis]
MSFPQRLRMLRKAKGLTQEELGRKVNVTKVSISGYESGNRTPDMDTLKALADALDVSIDYLLGRDNTQPTDTKLPALTEKDERDIQKELEKIIKGLKTGSGFAAFGGVDIDELDEEDRELLIASLENSLRLAKRIAKQKFTPKKYRKE